MSYLFVFRLVASKKRILWVHPQKRMLEFVQEMRNLLQVEQSTSGVYLPNLRIGQMKKDPHRRLGPQLHPVLLAHYFEAFSE